MPDEIAIVHGLPVTSEARTWVDLAEAMMLPTSSPLATACYAVAREVTS
jgi:predicted metal-binding membrane protein